MFKEVSRDFDQMSISDKRQEINSEFMYLYLLYEQLCTLKNVQYRTVIDEDLKEFIDSAETEDELKPSSWLLSHLECHVLLALLAVKVPFA